MEEKIQSKTHYSPTRDRLKMRCLRNIYQLQTDMKNRKHMNIATADNNETHTHFMHYKIE